MNIDRKFSSKKQVPVTIVIVNWNAGLLLQDCIAHLSQQTVTPDRIIVVDNASTDDSIANIKSFDSIEIISLKENTGFAKGNNIALEQISTPFVALVNPDAFPEPDWLEQLLISASKHPEAASFGSMQLKDNLKTIDGIGDCYHISGLMWRSRHGKPIRLIDQQEKEIFSPCAAAALYRMDALRRVGFFEESFFCYCEDIDLGFRLRLAGYSSWYQPLARVKHLGSATTGGKHSNFSVYYGHRNLIWVYWRNLPLLLLIFSLPIHISANILAIITFTIKGQFSIIIRSKIDGVKELGQVIRQRRDIQKNRNASIFSLLKYINFLR
jgi:GT2 family glycosyltransferase